jgi:hypothetical protein
VSKSKYETNVAPRLTEVEGWARNGVSDEDIAHNLGVAYSTFRKYKEANAALSAALARGKEVVDLEVEGALLKRCMGYNARVAKHYKIKTVDYDENGKKTCEREELKEVYDEVHIPADTTAQMFWLANRKKKDWKYKPDEDKTGADDDQTGVVLLPEIAEDAPAAEVMEGGDGEATL